MSRNILKSESEMPSFKWMVTENYVHITFDNWVLNNSYGGLFQ